MPVLPTTAPDLLTFAPVHVVIEIRQRKTNDDYHAQIAGEPGKWGCGRNPSEAVGDLILSHAKREPLLLLEIAYPEDAKP